MFAYAAIAMLFAADPKPLPVPAFGFLDPGVTDLPQIVALLQKPIPFKAIKGETTKERNRRRWQAKYDKLADISERLQILFLNVRVKMLMETDKEFREAFDAASHKLLPLIGPNKYPHPLPDEQLLIKRIIAFGNKWIPKINTL